MTRKELLRKIYWTAATLVVSVLAIFLSVLLLNPTSVGSPQFVANINLWAVIWAFTFVLVLILSFVLARDVIKLFFEYQARTTGSRIKGKLITVFIIFSMFPALIMSSLAFGLINRNLRLWFASPTEQLLGSSEQIVASYYEQNRRLSLLSARTLAESIEFGASDNAEALQRGRVEMGFEAAILFESAESRLAQSGDWVGEENLEEAVRNVLDGADYYRHLRLNELGLADVDMVVVGIPLAEANGEIRGALLSQFVIPNSVAFHAIQTGQARQKQNELKSSINQAEINYVSILAMTTLAVVFGFVWLGAYIAKKITVPFEALAEGASELAGGNLDHRVDVQAVDELGILVDSFNRMAGEIKESRLELERANQELRSTNVELDERRRYTETVLQNIATGVISLDEGNVIRTVNQAAASMLRRPPDELLGSSLESVVGEDLQSELERLTGRAALYGTYRKNISFSSGEQTLFVAATATAHPLPAEDKKEFLIVLDDLTELIKAEKFAAWQEVARRLAHEIKNPLTPIQLSAERIKKRFETDSSSPEDLSKFKTVLDDGVRIITAEAEMLKTLVEEFSRFARLPISRPVETDLHSLLGQALARYDGGLQGVEVVRFFDPAIGVVRVDPEQMRRVFFNLLDNSLDALSDSESKRIEIATSLNRGRNSVTIEFRDNGPGIDPADFDNLFLPYFSRKKKGTGLGLAIVRQIVSEHNGFIRAEPNLPRGVKFLIDIPAG